MKKRLELAPRWRSQTLRAAAAVGLGALLLGACEDGAFNLTGDPLLRHMNSRDAEACRANVNNALAQRDLTADRIDRISYREIRIDNRVSGFEAWAFPKTGGGVMVVEMTMKCTVRQVWSRRLNT